MAIVYCNKCGDSFKFNENEEIVKKALDTIEIIGNNIENIQNDFAELRDNIPENYGMKDELAQNVDEYFDDISKDIQFDFLTPLENILQSGPKATTIAQNKDESIVKDRLNKHMQLNHSDNSNGDVN